MVVLYLCRFVDNVLQFSH